VGVVSDVRPSEIDDPVSLAGFKSGTDGMLIEESIVRVSVGEGSPVFPDLSVALATIS
jgi:hypothetical protein